MLLNFIPKTGALTVVLDFHPLLDRNLHDLYGEMHSLPTSSFDTEDVLYRSERLPFYCLVKHVQFSLLVAETQ